MIVFRKLTAQNFLSIGNNPIEIDLDKHDTTLIIGANGHGKSGAFEALSFARLLTVYEDF
jgi:predicted ATP-binding protein involved in virulence